MATSPLKICAFQQAVTTDRDANMAAAVSAAHQAADAGARLLLLQELHAHPYFCQSIDNTHFRLAESIPGPTTETLGAVAKKHEMVIVAPLFEKRPSGIHHNTAVVLDSDGTLAGMYRKMHIPDDPGYYEKYYFTPGDLGFTPIDTAVGRLGVLICWDQWFPEAARLMALAGADILLYPTAIGWHPPDDEAERLRQRDAWVTIQRAHAIANNLPVISCNRTGFEADPSGALPGIEFWGSSFICGPQGEILALAPADKEAVLLADVDLARSREVRLQWPFFRDRRVDTYGDLGRLGRD